MTTFFYVAFVLLWVLVLFQSLVLLGVVRTLYRGTEPIAGPGVPVLHAELIGQPVPRFEAQDLSGNRFVEQSLPPKLNALLFVTPDCVSCVASLEDIDGLRAKVGGNVTVVCRGTSEDCRQLREDFELGDVPVLLDQDRAVSSAFGIVATPTAVLIGANGRIRTYGQPVDTDDLARMMTNSASAEVGVV